MRRQTKDRLDWFLSELGYFGFIFAIVFAVAFAIVGGIGAGVGLTIYLIRLALGY